MGLRLPLTAAMRTNGLHRLIVDGVDEDSTPAQGARELSELFDAHYHTDGLAFVDPGTPTNNTGTVRSGDNRRGPVVHRRASRGTRRCRAAGGCRGAAADAGAGHSVA